jgi:hypothetical protein
LCYLFKGEKREISPRNFYRKSSSACIPSPFGSSLALGSMCLRECETREEGGMGRKRGELQCMRDRGEGRKKRKEMVRVAATTERRGREERKRKGKKEKEMWARLFQK